ncbi:hypothetical protein HELRODRAFT_64064 [Helobdella robusta]|uniref:PAT complex subunit CCDC47 n=1 Tax=Helobdella robusta TaxID=6412 RepID=T1FXN9_HELRO|nr:hypothetical protein HELRODRAFT_64064 [Helobdella robusta]ESO06377.1 hypothetical protein HELRODRAFT_64064 [Helobdella robusta]
MKCSLLLFLLILYKFNSIDASQKIENNEFAEFEEFDDEPQKPKIIMSPEAAQVMDSNEDQNEEEDDAVVEEDEEEFEYLNEDEFEGFDREKKPKAKSEQPPDLKIVKVPLHLHTNWDSFYMEILMLAGLGAYLLNYLAGKTKNQKLAQAWLKSHKQLLEENFSVIGDDGTTMEATNTGLMKEAENIYSLWCSGRTCCEGMLVTIKMLKRQDLLSTISRMFRPATDQIFVKVIMDDSDMDNFVFCLSHKRSITKLQKDHADLSNFCPEKKSCEKFLIPSHFQMLSECSEVTAFILDSKVTAVLKKYEGAVEYLHFSDQYAGVKQPEDSTTTKVPETQKVLIFCFNVTDSGFTSPKDMDHMKPLLQMVFYCMDKIKRFRLSKEAKLKADKNRQKVLELYQKATHSQRSEAAQNRKEEKRRAEKEKIMNEDDPDKQRKLEEKNLKKEAKRKQPKMKRMKIKAI